MKCINIGESNLCKYPNAAYNLIFFLIFEPKTSESVIKLIGTFACQILQNITNILNSVHIIQVTNHLKIYFPLVL